MEISGIYNFHQISSNGFFNCTTSMEQHSGNMKLGDFLNEEKELRNKRLALEAEVDQLQDVLIREKALNRVLTTALQGPIILPLCESSLIPPNVQVILAELVMVEEEILMLESEVTELKMNLYQERKKTIKRELQHKRKQRHYKKPGDDPEQLSKCLNYEEIMTKGKMVKDRVAFSGPLDMPSARPRDRKTHRRFPSGDQMPI